MSEGFFQTQSRLAAAAAPPAPTAQTVSELTARIDKAIKSGLPGTVLVKGEISNFKPHHGSGHLYFTLKDPSASIDCVMWKDAARAMKFTAADGLEVLAAGRVSVYAERGKYQLYVNNLSPVGQGALELAFRQLRDRLQKEGLFAPDHKKPLPSYPIKIALVTSAATAALQDMLKVLKRFPWLKLFLYDVPVQGEGASEKIAAAIDHLNRRQSTSPGPTLILGSHSLSPSPCPRRATSSRTQEEGRGGGSDRDEPGISLTPTSPIDVILLARGGGSLEDLWPFNEERVARAIFASTIPIVTGIGHEVDVSISDLVADHHAHTPTEAAQTITVHWRHAPDLLRSNESRLLRAFAQVIDNARHRLSHIERHEFFRRPADLLNARRQMLDDRQRILTLHVAGKVRRASSSLARLELRLLSRHPRHILALENSRLANLDRSLTRSTHESLHRRRLELDGLTKHLQAIGPEQVLRRGYTITTRKKDGHPLRHASGIKPGDALITRFPDGTIESISTDPRQPRLFP